MLLVWGVDIKATAEETFLTIFPWERVLNDIRRSFFVTKPTLLPLHGLTQTTGGGLLLVKEMCRWGGVWCRVENYSILYFSFFLLSSKLFICIFFKDAALKICFVVFVCFLVFPVEPDSLIHKQIIGLGENILKCLLVFFFY